MEQQLLNEAGPIYIKSVKFYGQQSGFAGWPPVRGGTGSRGATGHTAHWWTAGRVWCINFSFRLKYDLPGPISMFKTKTDTGCLLP